MSNPTAIPVPVSKVPVAVQVEDMGQTPTQALLAISPELRAKYPDQHLRFVNTKRTEIAETRVRQGYRALDEKSGDSRTVGELRLMACPKDLYEKRKKQRDELTKRRLGQIKDTAKQDLGKEGFKLEGTNE